jgi:hypothetical protein
MQKMLRKKVAQNVAISLGFFNFSKSYNEHPKVAKFAKMLNLVTLDPSD